MLNQVHTMNSVDVIESPEITNTGYIPSYILTSRGVLLDVERRRQRSRYWRFSWKSLDLLNHEVFQQLPSVHPPEEDVTVSLPSRWCPPVHIPEVSLDVKWVGNLSWREQFYSAQLLSKKELAKVDLSSRLSLVPVPNLVLIWLSSVAVAMVSSNWPSLQWWFHFLPF